MRICLCVTVAAVAALAAAIASLSPQPDLGTLAGKRVMICGASTGIGREIALAYAGHGAHVTVVSRSATKLEAVAALAKEEGAASATVVAADLADRAGAAGAVATAVEAMGGLDVLILNHIRPAYGGFEEMSLDLVESIVDVNLLSYLVLTHHAMPHLRASGGAITAVSSVAGKMGVPGEAVYAATKHALHGFFDSLRRELYEEMKAGAGDELAVQVSTAVVGLVETKSMREVTKGAFSNLAASPADEVALGIVRGTTAGLREIYVPVDQTTVLPAFFFPVLPGALIDWMVYNFS